MRLRIIQLLGLAQMQGAPAVGRRRFGVPPGGAFDSIALEYANALCGRESGAPALEIATTAFGEAPFLDAICEEPGILAVTGAECRVLVNGRETHGQGRLILDEGAQVQIGLRRRGMRVYLASTGVLSYSETTLSASGPELSTIRMDDIPESLAEGDIRFVPIGDSWSARSLLVEPSSNRVGLRLSGYQGEARSQGESEPSVLGAIQLTPGGELLVHGPDGPTTGGYPKLGVVISADAPRLAQLRPSQPVDLQPVSLAEAHRLRRELDERISTRTQSLRGLLAS